MTRTIAIIFISMLVGGYIATHLRAKAMHNPLLTLDRTCFSDGVYQSRIDRCGQALDQIILIDSRVNAY